MRGGVLALGAGLALVACTAEPEPPPFEVRPVVAPALAELEAAVRAEEDRARAAAAAESAEGFGDEAEVREHVRGLVHFASTTGGPLREAALEDVRLVGDAAVPHLAAILGEPERPPAERSAALDLLGALDSPLAAAHLAAHLERGLEPWVRARCAWHLGRGTQDWVVPRLVLRLKYETDHEAAVWVADALAALDNFSGVDTLRTLSASGGSEAVRRLAADRLAVLEGERGLPPPDELRDVWYQGDPLGVLPRRPRSARYRLEVWRRVAALDDFQLRGVDDARFVLARLGEEAARVLARALHDESPYVRLHAAQALERMGPRGRVAGPDLLAALGRPDLAPAAAAALGKLAYEPAEAALIGMARPGGGPDARIAAVRALGYLGRATSIDALRSVLDGEEPLELRQAAAESLLFVGAPELSVPFLLDLFAEPGIDPATSEAAVGWWLRRLAPAGDPRAAEVLAAWSALEPAPNAIEPPERVAARRREREALVRGALDALLPR